VRVYLFKDVFYLGIYLWFSHVKPSWLFLWLLFSVGEDWWSCKWFGFLSGNWL